MNVVPDSVTDHDAPDGIPLCVINIGYVIMFHTILLVTALPFIMIVPVYVLVLYPAILWIV